MFSCAGGHQPSTPSSSVKHKPTTIKLSIYTNVFISINMDKDQRKKAMQKVYNDRNKEYRREFYKKYYIKHTQKLKARRKSRLFFIRASSVSSRCKSNSALELTAIISRLWYKQRGRCALTGRKLTRSNAQVDHISPVSKGGNNSALNLRWVTKECNHAKSDLSDACFISLCRDIVAWAK